MKKIYCYVDETGQDTKGKLFLVAIVITGKERKKLREKILKIEKISKRGKLKWNKTDLKRKKKYLNLLLKISFFKHKIYFSNYEDTKAYMYLTASTTAKAIINKAKKNYKATVLVDGLKRKEVRQFSKELRKFNIRTRKIRGIRDESDALIRLADSMAGFIRDALEEDPYTIRVYRNFLRKKIIKKI